MNSKATFKVAALARTLAIGLVAATLVSAPVQQAAAQATQNASSSVDLSVGRGRLISLSAPMTDVFVADDKVADVQVRSSRQLYVFGKAPGETSIYATDASGRVVYSTVARVGNNIETIDQMLSLAMPDAKIASNTMNGFILLTGTVPSPDDAAEAERLVQAFVGDQTKVLSRLRTATPLQVNLQVRIAEVSRSLVKSLAVNMSTIDSTGGFKFGIGQGAVNTHAPGLPMGVGTELTVTLPDGTQVPGSSVDTSSTGSTLAAAGKLFGVNILGSLDAGETIGLVTTLAQPNLTALSGETAEFLAGGEYPIPISQALGTTSIEFKKYGISLSYSPTVLANGRISMRVRPEVSELSSQGAVNFNGYEVPALTVRRTETTVELGSGQSFMIAGLLSNNSTNTIQKLPGAGDLPILGSLFRSTSYKRGETELVIVVTPYLVNPVDASQIALPTDGFNAPNDLQRVLGNMESDGVSARKRPEASSTAAPGLGDAAGGAAPATGKTSKRSAADASVRPGFSLN